LVVAVSLVTLAPAKAKVEGHVWRASDAAVGPGTRALTDYRVQSVVLAAITMAVVLWWW
jgi:hypothetical protein